MLLDKDNWRLIYLYMIISDEYRVLKQLY